MPATAKHRRGFTLLESIIAILVAGFLAVLVLQMMGTQLLQSGTPLIVAQDASQAEALLEQVQSFFLDNVNNNTSGALDAVYSRYHSDTNSTITLTRNAGTFGADGVDSLAVVVTVGKVSFSTLLTQERTNSSDAAVSF